MIAFAILVSLLRSILSAGAPVTSNTDTTVSAVDQTPLFLTADRSTLQIIWTCAAIIFASSWVCIHPHIPGYKSTRPQRWGIRLRLFVNALLFPDQFVGRAYYEWAGSKALFVGMEKRLSDIKARELKKAETAIGKGETAGAKIKRLAEDTKVFVEEAERAGEEPGRAKEEPDQTKEEDDQEKEGVDQAKEAVQPGRDAEKAGAERGVLKIEELRARRRVLEVEWARVQRSMAQQLGEEEANDEPIFPDIKPRDWTMVHAHFIHMGGVVFQGPDNKMRFKDFRKWTDEDIEAFFALKLSKEKIQDCSKADGLAKAFVIIQCLWFVVQCIGRAAYGLLLIQLEVTCLAYIACNIGMYVFWWYKPLNVSCPERIQSQNQPEPTSTKPMVFPWYRAIIETLVTGDIGLLIFPSRGWDNDMVADPSEKLARFPVNYYYKHKSWGKYVEPLGQTVPMAIFGALHTIAWHGSFPTLAEKLLWRSSSIAPAILSLILLAYFAALECEVPPWLQKSLEYAACFTIPISFAARIGFIVQPLFQLRDLPPLAFQTVEWSDILPHV